MEKQVIFRDYQEQQAIDHSNLQEFARDSIDHVVNDAVTAGRRYAGFAVSKTAQTEVTVAAGRMYDVAGAVYVRASALVQSLTSNLAAGSKRIISISAYGVETETDTQERDFLTNVETGQTEPDSVAMTRSRDAVLVFTAGSESADPQPPALPVTHVEIARVLVDTIQVVSITMMTDNEVASTEELDQRAKVLETFKTAIEPRVSSLASDLSALANQLKMRGAGQDIVQLYRDMAIVKEALEIPDTASDYGADRFLTAAESDVDDTAGQGYDALVEEGARFPDANADEFELGIFSANDPNAKVVGGLLLPIYEDILKLSIATYHSDLGIAQYGFQTFDLTQLTMSRQRLRYGSVFTVCTNGSWWNSGTYDAATNTFQKAGETFEVIDFYQWPDVTYWAGHQGVRLRQVWTDTYSEPYWGYVTTDHSITGAQVAQTFLSANDMWLTRVGFYLTSKAANENVFLTLCETTNGQPDLSKAILHQAVDQADLVVNGFTRVAVAPTFLKAGQHYALVLTSNANHKIGMAYGQEYVDGTFFYSTDGIYYQGDLTKDMLLELWGARFTTPQVAIELNAINLDGGIRAIDILASIISPESTQLIFEAQPGGSGEWHAINASDLTTFAATPPLARFRARFIGTRDIHAGVMLTGSRCHLSRPKTAFKHVSTAITLASGSDDITVQCLLEGFDDTPHDFSLVLRHGVTDETADTVEDVVLPDLPNISGRLQRTFNFALAAPITDFILVATGTTTIAGNTFHWAERVHWAI